MRRLRQIGAGLGPAEDLLETTLDELALQWVDAAADRRDTVALRLGLAADAVPQWIDASRRLWRTLTDDDEMRRLGGPPLSRRDAGILRETIDHVERSALLD